MNPEGGPSTLRLFSPKNPEGLGPRGFLEETDVRAGTSRGIHGPITNLSEWIIDIVSLPLRQRGYKVASVSRSCFVYTGSGYRWWELSVILTLFAQFKIQNWWKGKADIFNKIPFLGTNYRSSYEILNRKAFSTWAIALLKWSLVLCVSDTLLSLFASSYAKTSLFIVKV